MKNSKSKGAISPKKINRERFKKSENSVTNTIKRVKNTTMHSLNSKKLFRENSTFKSEQSPKDSTRVLQFADFQIKNHNSLSITIPMLFKLLKLEDSIL